MAAPSDAAHERFDQARADATARFNEIVAAPAREYMDALTHLLEVEQRFVLDPSNAALTEESRAARAAYDGARESLDGTRRGALGARTRAIGDAWSEEIVEAGAEVAGGG